jgi:hypothetical protein
MDSMELHRLFAGEREFEIEDGDSLMFAFAEYAWIATFLGEPNSDFEQNLIFTANCSHSAEVMMLAIKPGADSTGSPQAGCGKHVTDFYKEQFIEQSGFDGLTTSGLSAEEHKLAVGMPLIRPTPADMNKGKEILAEHGVMPTLKPVIIHPGSGGAQKCWQLDNFLSVARMLASEGIEVVFLLGPAEMERFGASAMAKIGAAGRLLANLSLADVLAVLSCARGYVGNDSGITHLSAALGIRTVAVFGPTDPAVYGPVGPAVTILQSGEPEFSGAISEELQEKAMAALLQ